MVTVQFVLFVGVCLFLHVHVHVHPFIFVFVVVSVLININFYDTSGLGMWCIFNGYFNTKHCKQTNKQTNKKIPKKAK